MASTKEDIVYLSDLAPDFDPNKEYDTTDMVAVDGVLMHCTSAGRGEEAEFSPANVQDVIDAIDAKFSCLYWYPDGTVKSSSEWTSGLKYSYNEEDSTAAVLPFCNTGTAENNNSGLVGVVVIPPYVDKDGNRYLVTSIAQGIDNPAANYGLTKIIAPITVLGIAGNAIRRCTGLVSASFPGATSVGTGSFYACTSLSDIALPLVQGMNGYVFNGCTSIYKIALPSCRNLSGGNVFENCTSLKSIYLPVLENKIGGKCFNGCRSLEVVDFGVAQRVGIPALDNLNAFNAVPWSCVIVVPDANYNAWIAANRWSGIAALGYTFLKHSEWEYARRYEVRDKLDLGVYDFLPETWEVSDLSWFSGGTYTWDNASAQWLGVQGQRAIRAKEGSPNTYQLVFDPGLSKETTVCEWEGTAKQNVPFDYRGGSYIINVEGRGNSRLKPTGDKLAKKSEVAAVRNSIRYDLVEKTIAEGSVDLDDMTINYVDATNAQSVSLSFPESVDGKARDFAMVLVCGDTLPTIDYASIITIFAESGDELVPEKGFNVYSFTEIYGGRFVSSRELVESVVDNSPESTDQLLLAMERAGYPTQGVSSYGGVMQSMGLSDDKTPQDAINKIYE